MALKTDRLTRALSAVRERRPIVHAITNLVTASDVASALHALGARPIMASAPEEVEEVASGADALVLNLGTPSQTRIDTMLRAGHKTVQLGRPVIFDPVGVGASRFRVEASKRIITELRLAVIKGNQAEIGLLSAGRGQLAGVDAVSWPEDLSRAAKDLSKRSGAVVVASGPRDLIVFAGRRVVVENGHPMMASVTGLGCILSALIGAFAAVENDSLMAAIGAVAFFGLAGEEAARQAKGPGTFKTALFDLLFTLSPDEMARGMKLIEETTGG